MMNKVKIIMDYSKKLFGEDCLYSLYNQRNSPKESDRYFILKISDVGINIGVEDGFMCFNVFDKKGYGKGNLARFTGKMVRYGLTINESIKEICGYLDEIHVYLKK